MELTENPGALAGATGADTQHVHSPNSTPDPGSAQPDKHDQESITRTLILADGSVVKIDARWYEMLASVSWFGAGGCGRYPARTVTLHGGRKTTEFLHRLVTDARPGEIIDHADGDPHNATAANLRKVTWAQNSANRRPTSASGFLGVEQTRSGTFRGSVACGPIRLTGPCRQTPEEAAQDRDEQARQLWGVMTRYNYPRPGERGLNGALVASHE